MKTLISFLTLFYSICTFGQSDKKLLLFFDGYYETNCYIEKGEDEGSQDYLRFYTNGKVINVGTDCVGTVNELKEWFNLNAEQVGTGDYKIKRKKLFFSTNSKSGIIKYKGRLKKNGTLKLHWKSQINGSKGHNNFKYVPIVGMT
jgi:hypothetical protein